MSKAQEPIDAIMAQAQVFASAWSLVGGIFDSGQMLYEANESKAELRQMVTAALSASSEQQAAQQDAALVKPEAGRYVLAWTEVSKIPIRAMWVPAKWLEADDECPEDWAEYDEDKGQYFAPEGWYECNAHEAQHWSVSSTVVLWMDLPRLTVAARASNGGKAND